MRISRLFTAIFILITLLLILFFYQQSLISNSENKQTSSFSLSFLRPSFSYNSGFDDNSHSFIGVLEKYFSLYNAPKLERKYLVYIPHTSFGWGNQIRAFSSAFLMALLSDRILLISWPSADNTINLVMEDPFIPFRIKDEDNETGWHYSKDIHGKLSRTLNPIDEINIFQNQNWKTYLSDNKVLGVTSYSPFWRIFQRNPYHSDYLRRTLGANPVSFLTHFLIKPSDNVLPSITSMRKQFSNKYVLAVQIRSKNALYSMTDEGKTKFISCVDATINYLNNGEDKWLSKREVVTFWATDDTKLVDSFKENKTAPVYVFEGKVGHIGIHGAKDGFEIGNYTKEEIFERAFLDWYMLSDADMMLSTHCSSFGETAFTRNSPQTFFLPTSKDSLENCGFVYAWPRWCSELYKNY